MSETPLSETQVLPDYVQPLVDGSDSGVLKRNREKNNSILSITMHMHLCLSVCACYTPHVYAHRLA